MEETKFFTEIFEKIYSQMECNIMYVFLCGGDCKFNGSEKNKQIRNAIKSKLENNADYKIKVLYPEELFFDDSKKNLSEYFKQRDLLELETILANNSNIVCIICESIGSATELGAFTNYRDPEKNELLDKLVAVTYSKYQKDEPSFISEGPIKRLKYTKKHSTRHKVYEYEDHYNDNQIQASQNKLAQELVTEFHKICKINKKNVDRRIFIQKNSNLKNFIGLAYLILWAIYFYGEISTQFKPHLEKELDKLGVKIMGKFDDYYKLAICFLLNNQEYIKKNKTKSVYVLTQKGIDYIKNEVLSCINIKQKDLDYIRMKIMYNQMYKI